MKLKSPTDASVQVALLSGHAISIGPEGRDVPALFLKEALIAGAVVCEADETRMKEPCAVSDAANESGRMARIRESIKSMLEDGCELTRAGLPNRSDLSNLTGFLVSADELAQAWSELKTEADASTRGAA